MSKAVPAKAVTPAKGSGKSATPAKSTTPARATTPTRATAPIVTGKGRLRIVADVPSASGWVKDEFSLKGSFKRTLAKEDGLIIRSKSSSGKFNIITVPEADETWLGITWPGQPSGKWAAEKGNYACLALTAEDDDGTLVASYDEKPGCTQYKVWSVAPDTGIVSVNFVENNGTSHALQALVNVDKGDIRFVRASSVAFWAKAHPSMCKARLSFVAL